MIPLRVFFWFWMLSFFFFARIISVEPKAIRTTLHSPRPLNFVADQTFLVPPASMRLANSSGIYGPLSALSVQEE